MCRATTTLMGGLLTAVAFAAIGSAQAAWNQNRATAADTTLSQIVTSAVPSVSACVTIDGVVVYEKAFGNSAPGVAATPQTIYRIGSLSKQFTAAAILALIEDSAVVPKDGSPFGLQSNVLLFFPSATQWSAPGGAPLTIGRLLTQTSNLPTYTNTAPLGLDPNQPVQAQALLNAILALTPNAGPPVFAYSNTNYFLLAAIIDALTNPNAGGRFHKLQTGPTILSLNTDYRAYLRKRVFARAGLTATNFIDDPKPLGTLALPAAGAGVAFANPSWPKGAGAIQSNAADLCAWDSALMKNQVLNPQSTLTMGTPGYLGSNYAMGWYVNKISGALEYSHNGNIPGYTAENIIDLYNKTHFVSVAILTNGDYTPGLLQAGKAIATNAMKPPDLSVPFPTHNQY